MYGLIVIGLLWAAFVFLLRRDMAVAWAEPCLRAPVLVFEGDDWGFGPSAQADALRDIAGVLRRYADVEGRPPVMTLGVVLSGPDPARPDEPEAGILLDDAAMRPVLDSISEGVRDRVFSLQLHGMQHYHPAVLDLACRADPALAAWRRQPLAATEDLPSPLQSRWTDASVLPSRPLAPADIRLRATAEVNEFARVFGRPPAVAVPPTFVWNDTVEAAWAAAGVRVIVTPGERYEARGRDGLPVDSGHLYRNGQRCASGLMAVVRNDYYEPVRGHRAPHGLEALARKWRQRRPLLLETHRSNFVGRYARHQDSLQALDELLARATRDFPDIRFLSVETLAAAYAEGGGLIDRRLTVRLQALIARVLLPGRRRKVALLLCGLSALALLGAVLPRF